VASGTLIARFKARGKPVQKSLETADLEAADTPAFQAARSAASCLRCASRSCMNCRAEATVARRRVCLQKRRYCPMAFRYCWRVETGRPDRVRAAAQSGNHTGRLGGETAVLAFISVGQKTN